MMILSYELCYVVISNVSIQFLMEEVKVNEEAVHAPIRRLINTKF
jgi:hypothetical protein